MTTTMAISKEHIAKTPGVCGGKACIAGTRIRVMDIVAHAVQANRSPEELTTFFTTPISIADVYAALAYYFDHKDEIDGNFQEAREVADRMRAQFPTLREKRKKPAGIPAG